MVTDALLRNTQIKSLLLGTDGIGDQGAADVARLIERNEHLEIIYLGCNKIGEGGVGPVTRQLQQRYFDVVKGRDTSHPEWLTRV